MKISQIRPLVTAWSLLPHSVAPAHPSRIKTVLVLSIALLLSAWHGNSQVTLCAGSSYSYQFNTLTFERNATFGISEPSGAVALYIDPWSPTSLGPTNSYKVEMFADASTQAPILSRIITAASSIHDTTYRVPNAWGDLQGSIRVTALSGCIKLGGFSFQAIRAGNPEGFDIYGTDRIFLSAAPVLSVVQSNGFLTLRWPAAATNFVLEAASSSAPEASWHSVTNTTTTSGPVSSVTIALDDPGRLFRLKAQP